VSSMKVLAHPAEVIHFLAQNGFGADSNCRSSSLRR
jgi:hypothetical protein